MFFEKKLVVVIPINFPGFLNLCVQIVYITRSYKINANVEKAHVFVRSLLSLSHSV